jgi:hypothetical protein
LERTHRPGIAAARGSHRIHKKPEYAEITEKATVERLLIRLKNSSGNFPGSSAGQRSRIKF